MLHLTGPLAPGLDGTVVFDRFWGVIDSRSIFPDCDGEITPRFHRVCGWNESYSEKELPTVWMSDWTLRGNRAEHGNIDHI